MSEEHFVGKVALKAVLEHEGKVLLLRDPRMDREVWEISGGRMNIGEVPTVALKRELKEELGVECMIHEVVHLAQFLQGNENAQAFMIAFRATLVDPEATLALDTTEVAEVAWCTPAEALERELFPEYRDTLEAYIKINNL